MTLIETAVIAQRAYDSAKKEISDALVKMVLENGTPSNNPLKAKLGVVDWIVGKTEREHFAHNKALDYHFCGLRTYRGQMRVTELFKDFNKDEDYRFEPLSDDLVKMAEVLEYYRQYSK